MSQKIKIVPGLLTIPSVAVCGGIVGAFVASRLVALPADGWDQIAQMLGGLMLGSLCGLVLAIVLVIKASPRWLWRIAAVATTIAVVVLAVAYSRRPLQELPASQEILPAKPSTSVAGPAHEDR